MTSSVTASLLVAMFAMFAVGCDDAGNGTDSSQSSSEVGEQFEAEDALTLSSVELPAEAQAATVERIIDGDSLEMTVGGRRLEVRLVGLNAVEARTLSGDSSCLGAKATKVLEGLIDSSDEIFLVEVGEDRYDRTLADVYVRRSGVGGSQETFSAVKYMIASGSGMARESGDLAQIMVIASEKRFGIWGAECGTALSDTVSISDSQVNPPGRDEDNLNEEWIELSNSGDAEVDLNGWMVRDYTTTNRFEISGTIASGAKIKVRSGMGSDDSDNIYLDSEEPILSNEFEVIVLVDPAGNFVDWRFEGVDA